MFQMVINVIGLALFIGIYAYALSTEPPSTLDVSRPSGHARRAFAHT